MKVNRIKVGAVIPVAQYANLQPEVEIHDVDHREGIDSAMSIIKNMFEKFSERGPLNERDVSSTIQKNSFNESGVVIEYNDDLHEYYYQGNKLISATGHIKQFYKEFDSQAISKASSRSWGVDQVELSGLWDSNSTLTSLLGKTIHSALEHYDRYKSVGSKISETKELDTNYAMPKHPFLKKIIEGFIAVNKTEGVVIPEALITNVESGFCGHADRVLITDEKNKRCRIQDYKVNINSEEINKSMSISDERFSSLPSNKISKYQLQMSVYANMMEKSGWVVEGLDVFILEDEWKHYKLDVLQVI